MPARLATPSAAPVSPLLTWEALNNAYPSPDGTIEAGCASYENQCAIRMSRALQIAGLPFASYADPVCSADGYSHARGAESLANYLWRILRRTMGTPLVLIAPRDDTRVRGKKGIIFFKDITGFREGRGDHIDLWDGAATKGYNGFGVSQQVWFWELQ
jgi:hypothetical protein